MVALASDHSTDLLRGVRSIRTGVTMWASRTKRQQSNLLVQSTPYVARNYYEVLMRLGRV